MMKLKVIVFSIFIGGVISTNNPAMEQLKMFASENRDKVRYAHNEVGAKVPSLTASQTVGPAGPVVLRDFTYLDHIAHFDRERIPERVVHAKGFGARGTFEVTHDISQLSKACVFKPGTKVPISVRFSTILGERGSADTMHDGRGFSVKFYTPCGNWDIVGNNIEVFQIRDPMLFPNLIRSRKRNPQTGLRDPTAWWDFTSLRPETTFHTVIFNSYMGFPAGVRFMDGAGIHSFKLVAANGTAVYVKFHFVTEQGNKHTTPEEAMELTKNPDHFQMDLYNAIAKGEYPSWKLMIQVMTYDQARQVNFDPHDSTKLWPRDQFPLRPVGRLVLNKNPENYFQDVEQIAFSPSNLIPGIEPSPDRLLHGRLFSYPDTQRHRLGPNFNQIPVNRPVNYDQIFTYAYDGACSVKKQYAGPNYYPSSFGSAVVDSAATAEHAEHVDAGDVIRNDLKDKDNYSQVTKWYHERSPEEQKFIANAIAANLKPVTEPAVRERAIANFDKVDAGLGKAIRQAGGW